MRRLLISLLACLSALTIVADDQTLVKGEYWIDSQYNNRTTVSISDGEMNFTVDASGLSEGVHRLQVRVQDSNNNYSPVLSWMFYRLANVTAEGTLTLEYWVDSGTHLTQPISNNMANFTIDGSGLGEGLHRLSYFVKSSTGYESPMQQWLFYRERLATDLATRVQKYEYWVDDKYNSRQTGTVTGNEVEFSLNAASLSEGVHTLNYRLCNDKGSYSPTQSWVFFRTAAPQAAGTTTVEYWIDEGSHKTQQLTSTDGAEFSIDVSTLAEGVHTLYYRLNSTNGKSSPMQAWKFYSTRQQAGGVNVTWYRTWWNDRQELAQRVGVSSASAVYELNQQFGVPVYAGYFCNEDGSKAKFNIQFGNESGVTTEVKSSDVTRTGVEFYAIGSEFTPSANYEVQATTSVKLTFGADSKWLHMQTPVLGIRENSVSGSLKPTDATGNDYDVETRLLPRQGSYYVFTPNTSGSLRAGVNIKAGKPFYVVNGRTGEPVTDFDLQDVNGNVAQLQGTKSLFCTLSQNLTGVCTVHVTADTPYYLFTTNDQLRFYGFEFYKGNIDIDPRTTAAIKDSIEKAGSIIPYFTLSQNKESLTIGCKAKGATIYFTTDGTIPKIGGQSYTSALTLSHNCTVKAISVIDGIPSSVAEYVVDWFTVGNVVFTPTGYLLKMESTTAGAKIYFTTDGTQPTTASTSYTGVLSLTQNCTVKAFAVKKDFNDSQVTSYEFNKADVTLAMPQISRNDNQLTIKAGDNDTIYYTLDGSIPTKSSSRYTTPFEVSRNCTVKAIAMRDNYFDSEMAEFSVNWFKVATPTFSVSGTMLSISSTTKGAEIYYAIGEDVTPTINSTHYTGAFKLNDNRPVKAFAVLDGYIDSDIAVFDEKVVTSLGVDMAYNGRYLTITPKESTATVYYTIDGTVPTTSSDVYTQPIVIDRLLTVKAAAMRPNTKLSEVSSLELTYLYDGEVAAVKDAGLLSKAFEWCGNDAVESLHIHGPINDDDLETIRGLSRLQTLDMENTSLTALPDNALKGARMRWFISPKNLSAVGNNVFVGCNRLAAITLQTDKVRLTEQVFGNQCNPNMLYYVKSENSVGISGANIISNGRSRDVTLYDGSEYCDFFCPTAFTADAISYTHNYRMKTKKGVCQGWETLALPFDVQTISHEKNGEMIPFAGRLLNDGRKPFWLAELDYDGFTSATSIVANKPYIISMPNDSAVYADRNLLAGNVTFSSKAVTVQATDIESNKGNMGDVVFMANYELREPSADIYAINLYERYDVSHAEGSIFLPDYRVTHPFEAYTNSVESARPFISIEDLSGENPTSIQEYIIEHTGDNNIYNLHGVRVKTQGKGVYIKNGKKIIVK